MKTVKYIMHTPRVILVGFIRIYQKTLSPDYGWFKRFYPGGYCKYQPSCSEYGAQAIEKYGAVVGGSKAVWRVMRCNPWSRGGEDLP